MAVSFVMVVDAVTTGVLAVIFICFVDSMRYE